MAEADLTAHETLDDSDLDDIPIPKRFIHHPPPRFSKLTYTNKRGRVVPYRALFSKKRPVIIVMN